MSIETLVDNLKGLKATVHQHLVAEAAANQKLAESSDKPTTLGKCRLCVEYTKVPWWKTAWHYIKSLWVYWRLSAKEKAFVKHLMAHPEDAPRQPNKVEPYRFFCSRCQKLVPSKNVGAWPMVDDVVLPSAGARSEGAICVGFEVRCHGETAYFDTSLVYAYCKRPCHEVVHFSRPYEP